MVPEENGFLEYLQLQGSDPVLVTKSELLSAVRQSGYSVGDRQLTFYISEGLVPKSVRVGSRAGAYPRIVIELLIWILRAKEGGLSVEAIRELLPVWKYLIRARNGRRIDLGELQYIARQHVRTIEGSYAIPPVVANVLIGTICDECSQGIRLVDKDGNEKSLCDPATTIGFAIARRGDDESGETEPRWIARTRIALVDGFNGVSKDPTTVILGLGPNETLPPDPADSGSLHPKTTSDDLAEAP